MIRVWARRYLPLPLRQWLAGLWRQGVDVAAGRRFSGEFHRMDTGKMHLVCELRQPVLGSELLHNKRVNLSLGLACVNRSLLPPGARWSFWQRVGWPGWWKGYRTGRNLVSGRLVRQRAGGLCQLSGLVYHLALQAGLRILERHAHSVDIYQDHERSTPLGADATVVWGVKDLRLENPYPCAIVLECFMEADWLIGRIHAGMPLPSVSVTFQHEAIAPRLTRVQTFANGLLQTSSDYTRLQPDAAQAR